MSMSSLPCQVFDCWSSSLKDDAKMPAEAARAGMEAEPTFHPFSCRTVWFLRWPPLCPPAWAAWWSWLPGPSLAVASAMVGCCLGCCCLVSNTPFSGRGHDHGHDSFLKSWLRIGFIGFVPWGKLFVLAGQLNHHQLLIPHVLVFFHFVSVIRVIPMTQSTSPARPRSARRRIGRRRPTPRS